MAIDGGRDAEVRRAAIDPTGSFIVQAPAGSGKTSLLTLRFLRLLATVDCPEQIVAITFTRKAASEMRHRIVRALASAAHPLPAGARLHEREQHALAQAALAHSRARGWDLERNPARLHVQTIDGLNHWLARRLPLAARIGMSATLVDDALPLYREAARRLVASLDTDAERADPLERLARALDHEPQQLARLVAEMLGTREVWLPKLPEPGGEPQLRASIDRLLAAALEAELGQVAAVLAPRLTPDFFRLLREAARAGGADSPLTALAGLQALPPAVPHVVPEWRALADLLLTADPEGALRRSVDRRQGFRAASAGPPWAELKQRMLEQLEALAQADGCAAALARVRRLPPPALTDAQWERIAALAGVLRHAVAELVVLLAERGSLDHPAVAAAARAALCEDAAPTELALALDYRIRHLLVDEYQDTSPAQEQLLRLLLAGWQQDDGRTLFCVGDPMQSIYAFREADVTLFLQAERQGVGGVPLTPLSLSRNFRSSAAIVDWVNAAFAELLPQADDFERGAVRYSAAEAVHAAASGDGVHVHALLDADERCMGVEVAGIARSALAAAAGERSSIAVLVRGRNSLPAIIAALREAGIDYRGVELESLTDRTAVRDLVALAKAMLHAGDRTAWLAVLRAPWCGLALPDLFALAGGDAEAPVPSLIADPAALGRLSTDGARRLERLRQALLAAIAARGRRSLGGWLKSAWLAIAGPATVLDPSDLANAELLFRALDELEVEAGCSPEASAVDAAVAGIMASPVGRDEAPVQVMTIHKAKGLEFDVVIVPDLQRSVRGGERPLLYWTQVATGPGSRGIVLASRAEQDAEDEGADALERWMRHLAAEREALELGRVAYVAATRARRELHLIGSASVKWTDDGAELRKPQAGSLLRFFWPVLVRDFEAALAAGDGAVARREPEGRRRLTALPLARLPLSYLPPTPHSPPRPRQLRIAGEAEGSIRPEFDWAGAIAQAVGQVVHFELYRLARLGLPRSALCGRDDAWRRALAEAGVDEAHLPAALARTAAAMDAFATSELAGKLLDPAAREAAGELALSAVVDGVVQGLRIDRSFVDAEGVRWIVDWKTGTHEGGDREAFLDHELARYAPQLKRYARAMRAQDGRPQRVGLYFPLLDAWREI
ncbi:MAG: UvrD-helicase domain-containing protein [Gammaproteobacteria bacterium]